MSDRRVSVDQLREILWWAEKIEKLERNYVENQELNAGPLACRPRMPIDIQCMDFPEGAPVARLHYGSDWIEVELMPKTGEDGD